MDILKTPPSNEIPVWEHGSREHGLLPGCMLLFRGEKSNKDADYHTEMNTAVFQHWMLSKVFPKLRSIGKKCVIVLDRATYHTQLTWNTRRPKSYWLKREIQNCVVRWGGPPALWGPNWYTDAKITKAVLLEHALRNAPPQV